jgi:hypothetical protein
MQVDKLKDKKDTLLNFVRFVHAEGTAKQIDGDDATIDALVERFLCTQESQGDRFAPCCDHCGSSDVKAATVEEETLNPDDSRKRIATGNKAEVWHCACGFNSPREP